MDNLQSSFLAKLLIDKTHEYVNQLPYSYQKYFDLEKSEIADYIKSQQISDTFATKLELSFISMSYAEDHECCKNLLKKVMSLSQETHLLVTGLLPFTTHPEYENHVEAWSSLEKALINSGAQHLVIQHIPLTFLYSKNESFIQDFQYFAKEAIFSEQTCPEQVDITFVAIHSQGFNENKVIQSHVK